MACGGVSVLREAEAWDFLLYLHSDDWDLVGGTYHQNLNVEVNSVEIPKVETDQCTQERHSC